MNFYQGEHSAILLTCIKRLLVSKTFFRSFCGRFTQVFAVITVPGDSEDEKPHLLSHLFVQSIYVYMSLIEYQICKPEIVEIANKSVVIHSTAHLKT